MKKVYCFLLALTSTFGSARTLEVGPFREFLILQAAAAAALPGDTILLRGPAIHSGGEYIENLQGTPEQWITIRVADGEEVIYRGGSSAFHMTDPAYIRIEGLIFEQQTGNGVNIDDGGTPLTPAHHIIIENCQWRSMNATGNNDELKLSGLDHFAVRKCRFTNGSTGGSLVDMVGCHFGAFEDNHFENGGSNSIQAKGGTKDIFIQRNKFRNGGERAINIGGSTGLAFFRPIDANYEASNIYVYSNIFIGSAAAVAFVGAINSEVINNTIQYPTRWAVRILQETVDTARFLPCGNNIFRNNIIAFNSQQPAFNIGPNTAPETFTISNNLWYHPGNASWVPNTPVTEPDRILGLDPQFADSLYNLQPSSPAIAKGFAVLQPERDFYSRLFPLPRSIGAVEFSNLQVDQKNSIQVRISPNPSTGLLTIHSDRTVPRVAIIDIRGVIRWQDTFDTEKTVDISAWPSGPYFLHIGGVSYLIVKE